VSFEKDFLVYINSNHDNFTEKDVKWLIRNFGNKVTGIVIEKLGSASLN